MNYFSFGNGFGQNFNNYYDFRIRSVSKGAKGKEQGAKGLKKYKK